MRTLELVVTVMVVAVIAQAAVMVGITVYGFAHAVFAAGL